MRTPTLLIATFILGSCGTFNIDDVNVDTPADEEEISDAVTVEEEEDSDDKDASANIDTSVADEEISVQVDVGVDVTVNVNTGESSAADRCAPNKLCRGMTRQEVHDIIGDPSTTEDFIMELRWHFKEPKGDLYYCADTFWILDDQCHLAFTEYGPRDKKVWLLDNSSDMNPDWIDVVNY
jgi:hypothetical protein